LSKVANINYAALDPSGDMPAGLKDKVQEMKSHYDFYVLDFGEKTPEGSEVLFKDGQDYMMKIIAVPKSGGALHRRKPEGLCLV